MINIEGEFWVFWKYDLFPHCLGGKASKANGDKFYVGSYMSWFKPFLILEGKAGEDLHNSLKQLEHDRNEDLKQMNNRYEELLDQIIEIPGINT